MLEMKKHPKVPISPPVLRKKGGKQLIWKLNCSIIFSNTLKGGDKSHSVASLSGMFRVLAQKMKDTRCDEEIEPAASSDKFASATVVADSPSQNTCLVFKMEGIA